MIEDGDVVLWEANEPGVTRQRSWAVLLGSAAVLAIVGTATVVRLGSAPSESKADDSVGLVGGAEMIGALASSLSTASNLVKDAQSAQKDLQGTYDALSKPAYDTQKEVLAEKPPKNVTDHLKSLHGEELFGKEDTNDGNPCPDDEEAHMGLCYAKCSAITKGEYPIRTTAFACCREQPCSIFNTKFTAPFKFCTGNDVAGHREGGGCPHTPGDCLKNEELFLGECLKQCAILTDNEFTFRTGPASCCKYQTKMACLDPVNSVTSPSFSVGGGVDDPDYGDLYGEAHAPVAAIAEVQTTTTLPTLPPVPELPVMETPSLPPMPTLAPLPELVTPAPLVVPALAQAPIAG